MGGHSCSPCCICWLKHNYAGLTMYLKIQSMSCVEYIVISNMPTAHICLVSHSAHAPEFAATRRTSLSTRLITRLFWWFWLGPPDFRHGDNRKWVHNIFTSSQENGPSHWYLIMYFVSVAAKKSSLTVSVVKPSFASTVGSSSSQDNQGEDVLSLTVPSKLVHV